MNNNLKIICQNLCKKIVEIEKTECSICYYNISRGTIIIPCGHYEICNKCCAQLNTCPLCRKSIEKVIEYKTNYNNKKRLEFNTWWPASTT